MQHAAGRQRSDFWGNISVRRPYALPNLPVGINMLLQQTAAQSRYRYQDLSLWGQYKSAHQVRHVLVGRALEGP